MKKITGRRVFEDENYLVLWSKFLGLDIPLLGSVFVQLKETGAVTRATFREKNYVLALIGEITRLGPTDMGEQLESVFEEFAGAVFARGFLRWRLFFSEMSPAAHALEFVAEDRTH
ncbi:MULTISPECIES: hypothetical protein [Dyella]|uniref:Uncharacterized protein n=2 Tax=Dyella TaxID=231454 RepID=A0A4V6NA21_9GAMM|nr:MULTISPECIES: hypothetical protein [Dyella]TBR39275.1 hypothetical protein EYV96_03355 [Dyella terrae]TCI13137.1 hypothetical protein EZM97_07510 [Dyella soli]